MPSQESIKSECFSRRLASRVGSADNCRALYLCGGIAGPTFYTTTESSPCVGGGRAAVISICGGGATVFDTTQVQQHSTTAGQENLGRHYSTGSSRRNMDSGKTLAEQLFLSSLESLQPEKLLERRLTVDGSKLKLLARESQPEKHFNIPDQGLFLVGFGKAVLGIAAHLVSLLEKQVLKGVLDLSRSRQCLEENNKC